MHYSLADLKLDRVSHNEVEKQIDEIVSDLNWSKKIKKIRTIFYSIVICAAMLTIHNISTLKIINIIESKNSVVLLEENKNNE